MVLPNINNIKELWSHPVVKHRNYRHSILPLRKYKEVYKWIRHGIPHHIVLATV